MNRLCQTLVLFILVVSGGCTDRAGPSADPSHNHETGQADGGRDATRIDPEVAAASGIVTAVAGPGLIDEVVTVYGRVAADPTAVARVAARFPGMARSVRVAIGDRVRAGEVVAEIESDAGLNRYTLSAPIAGIVTERLINPGEHTGDRVLFRIVDTGRVWGELALFPSVRSRISVGQRVDVSAAEGRPLGTAPIDWIGLAAGPDQSVTARVRLENGQGLMVPGQHLTGRVHVAVHEADVVVGRSALQNLDSETVVFVRERDSYRPRVVRTGRQDAQRVEIVEGVNAGDEYVSANSYLIKADLEKADAGHEH